MLAKGHDFPNVTLVGILDVDSGLFSIDFHATEKMAQMIVQVSGRAGRSEKPGQVIMQTRQPEHPLLLTLIRQGYRQFAMQTLLERQQAGLPPYSYQALFRVLSVDKQLAIEFLEQLSALALAKASKGVEIMGPVPAPMARRAGRFRYQLLIQARKRANLHALLDHLVDEIASLKSSRKVRWSLDVDPVDLY
jgi:primosomal protein N' (replication factor Y)